MVEKSNQHYGLDPFDPRYFVQVANQTAGPLDSMLEADRKDILDRMDSLEAYITQRKDIMYENLDRIDQDSCDLGSKLNSARLAQPYDHMSHNQLERNLFDLERQKREEKTHAWKDVWLISKELLEVMKDYQNFKKMEDLGM